MVISLLATITIPCFSKHAAVFMQGTFQPHTSFYLYGMMPPKYRAVNRRYISLYTYFLFVTSVWCFSFCLSSASICFRSIISKCSMVRTIAPQCIGYGVAYRRGNYHRGLSESVRN
jgi:hypothetical protein